MLVPILISLLLAQSVALFFLVWAVWPVIVTEWARITGPNQPDEDFKLCEAWVKAALPTKSEIEARLERAVTARPHRV